VINLLTWNIGWMYSALKNENGEMLKQFI
jgi:hypothetical protein